MSIEQRAEELASDLGVDKEEVTSDLENLVAYDVPIEEAVQSLRRKYGDGSTGSATPESKDIAELTTEDDTVAVTGRVLTVGKRSIMYRGEEQVIFEGRLADETGIVDYTAWTDFGLEVGDTITVGNAGVREWEGEPELNLGESTTVSTLEDPLEVPYEVGGDATLVELESGDRGVAVEVAVLEVERRTIDGRSGETDILSGVFGDDSAKLPFTDWDPHLPIEDGRPVRIENAYVREFRGVPEVNVSEFSTVTTLDRTVDTADTATRMPIREAVESGGVYDVELVGTVIAVRDGSGLIQRCPECGRVVQKNQCRTHGQVEAEDDLRVRAVLDDGTATTTVVLDETLTEAVYGGDIDDARAQAREAMDQSVVAETIRGRIVGHEYRVEGHLSVDDYGANLDATSFDRVADDPAERARELLAVVEGEP